MVRKCYKMKVEDFGRPLKQVNIPPRRRTYKYVNFLNAFLKSPYLGIQVDHTKFNAKLISVYKILHKNIKRENFPLMVYLRDGKIFLVKVEKKNGDKNKEDGKR